MSAIDFQELQLAVVNAARQALEELLQNDHDICAFALYSDPDASTICPAANTASYLTKMQAGDPADALYYKFTPAEWRYEAVGAPSAFGKVNAILKSAAGLRAAERTLFKNNVYEICMKALDALRKGCAGDMLLMFSVSDADVLPEIEIARAVRLNGQQVLDEVKNWTKSWAT